jgi:hypothetical protein
MDDQPVSNRRMLKWIILVGCLIAFIGGGATLTPIIKGIATEVASGLLGAFLAAGVFFIIGAATPMVFRQITKVESRISNVEEGISPSTSKSVVKIQDVPTISRADPGKNTYHEKENSETSEMSVTVSPNSSAASTPSMQLKSDIQPKQPATQGAIEPTSSHTSSTSSHTSSTSSLQPKAAISPKPLPTPPSSRPSSRPSTPPSSPRSLVSEGGAPAAVSKVVEKQAQAVGVGR